MHKALAQLATRTDAALALAVERLLVASPAELDSAIDAVLADALRLVDAEGVSLYLFGRKRHCLVRYATTADTPAPPWASVVAPWIERKMRQGEVLALTDVAHLPPEAAEDRVAYQRSEVRSALVVPLRAA